jgi:hypothetical protein
MLINFQLGTSKRVRTELATLEYEVAAVKKLLNHQGPML